MAKTPPASKRSARAALDSPPSEPASVAATDNIKDRLSVPLTSSGTIDFTLMRPSNREKLKAALADTATVTRELGIGLIADAAPVAAAVAPGDAALFAMVLDMLYDGIASAAVVALRARGLDDRTAELLRVTDKEKESMRESHIALLAKYNITSGAYAVELNAAASVAMVVLAKYAVVKAALASAPVAAPPVVLASQPAA